MDNEMKKWSKNFPKYFNAVTDINNMVSLK